MFGVSSMRRWVSFVLLGLLTVSLYGLVGCGEKEEVDPYVYDSMRRIMEGDTLSIGFLFEIDAPEFDYVKGDVAIVRNGNLLNFLVATDLEQNYRNLNGAMLGVRKAFTPQPTHLIVQRIKRGGVIEADSLAAPTGYILPRLLRAGAVDLELPGAPLPAVGWKRAAMDEATGIYLPEEEGDALKTIQSAFATFSYRPRHDLVEETALNPGAEDYAWYAIGDECSLEILELTPGAEWMLHMMLEKDLPLVGAFTVLSLETEYKLRKIEHEGLGHVVGAMKVNWFKFGNTFVEASVEE